MAGQPEPLRLFDIVEAIDDKASQPETVRCPSRKKTPSTRSTTAPPSSLETSSAPSDVETADAGGVTTSVTAECLRQVGDAATMEEAAKRALVGAISAARSAGCTWRAIGIATGIPYQTLHRRSARLGPGVTIEGDADVLAPTEAQRRLGGPVP